MRISLPNGQALEENVVGIGESKPQAFAESLTNLCETTLEPLFAEFVGEKDEFVKISKVRFDGKERTVYQTGWSRRGVQPADDKGMEELMTQVFARMNSLKLNSQAHWGKLVLWSGQGKVNTVNLMIDNQERLAEAESIKGISWPKTEKIYMLKLFFVVHAGTS